MVPHAERPHGSRMSTDPMTPPAAALPRRTILYVTIDDADYMVSIADRGADALAASGRIGRQLADALKAEARRRVEQGSFFGHVAYASVLAAKPD